MNSASARSLLIWLFVAGATVLAHLVLFVAQTLLYKELSDTSDAGTAPWIVSILAFALWLGFGYMIYSAIARLKYFPIVLFSFPAVLLTFALLMLNILFPPNEFLTVFIGVWFIPTGYFLGGYLAHQRT